MLCFCAHLLLRMCTHLTNCSFTLQQPTEEELALPLKEVILKRYSVLLAEKVQLNVTMIDIGWLMKAGSHWLVTARGRQVLVNSMNEMGILTMECLLVQQLPESEWILNNGAAEYVVIDSNHHVMTAQQLFPNRSFKWCCDLVNVCILCLFTAILSPFYSPPIPTAVAFGG